MITAIAAARPPDRDRPKHAETIVAEAMILI
jgi:hypothetical protein